MHCAASGLQYPPLVPLWEPDTIRLQTIRAGFPCFNAALAGYVEATRDDDRERNRLCPPNTLPDSLRSWAEMQVRGTLATRAFGAEPDIAAWANGCALNPARIQPAQRERPRGAGGGRPRRRGGRAGARPDDGPGRHHDPPDLTRGADGTVPAMTATLDTDYLVIGAGLAGMAFTDALIAEIRRPAC